MLKNMSSKIKILLIFKLLILSAHLIRYRSNFHTPCTSGWVWQSAEPGTVEWCLRGAPTSAMPSSAGCWCSRDGGCCWDCCWKLKWGISESACMRCVPWWAAVAAAASADQMGPSSAMVAAAAARTCAHSCEEALEADQCHQTSSLATATGNKNIK